MCENYEPIARSRAQLLNLYEPTFEYKAELFPGYDEIEKKEGLMKAMECVHQRFGKKKIGIGPCFVPNRNWSMSRIN